MYQMWFREATAAVALMLVLAWAAYKKPQRRCRPESLHSQLPPFLCTKEASQTSTKQRPTGSLFSEGSL
jgi:hypothetical protein